MLGSINKDNVLTQDVSWYRNPGAVRFLAIGGLRSNFSHATLIKFDRYWWKVPSLVGIHRRIWAREHGFILRQDSTIRRERRKLGQEE